MCPSPHSKDLHKHTYTRMHTFDPSNHSYTQDSDARGAKCQILKDHDQMQILMFLSQTGKNPQFSIKSDLQ